MAKIEKDQETVESNELRPKIIVIGVGGAGGNAVNNMIRSNLEGVHFVVANTDDQDLAQSLVERENRIQLGINVTQGLGAGSNPEIGCAAAEESVSDIMRFIEGANMVFITAGMGGGTGTGAAPVVARTARESGILTVGVVTKPFSFEGAHRTKTAEKGIEELQQYVDTLLVIPNQNLFRLANETTTFADAFKMADNVLYSGVRGVTDLMIMPGLINLDFADIRSVMSEMGKAMMGTGEAEGENRALDAAETAIANPLLDDVSLKGANGVLINITGGFDMTLYEVDEAANRIREEVDTDANIIFGSTFDERLNGKIRVSVVATGIGLPGEVGSFSANRAQPKNSSMKMFEGIDFAVKGASTLTDVKKDLTENYPEITETESEPSIYEEEEEPRYFSKKSSFFDMFRTRSANSKSRAEDRYSRPKQEGASVRQSNSVIDLQHAVKQQQEGPTEKPQTPEEEYDIPSCFRRKNR